MNKHSRASHPRTAGELRSIPSTRRWRSPVVAAGIAMSLVTAGLVGGLAGCGGGDASVAPPPTPTAPAITMLAGVVGGDTGALTLGGMALTVDTASVTVNGKTAAADEVQPGDVVEGTAVDNGSSLSAETLNVKIEITGAISSLDPGTGTLVVLGQTVVTDALTRICKENMDGGYTTLTLADLNSGDYVEVSGLRQADQTVLATRIERKSVNESSEAYDEVDLHGIVSALDVGNRRFMIGNVAVDYANATVKGTLADGLRVEVEGQMQAGLLMAREVEVKSQSTGSGGSKVELEGPVENHDPGLKRFRLLGYAVDYANARIEGSFADASRVEVEGRFDTADPNLVRAEKVETKHAQGGSGVADGEVKGFAANVDQAARTLDVGELGFWADDFTLIERNDWAVGFAEIANGSYVEVKFDSTRNVAGRAYAVKIELKTQSSGDSKYEIKGNIAAFNADARSFSLNGQLIQVDAQTRYEVYDQKMNADAFWSVDRNGQRAEVEGSLAGNVLTAQKIEID